MKLGELCYCCYTVIIVAPIKMLIFKTEPIIMMCSILSLQSESELTQMIKLSQNRIAEKCLPESSVT